jgi:RHS repeat-associated protein
MGGRSWSQNRSYRFGFNGKETDEETGLQDYGFRIYHPAISKFLSVDPLAPDYPWYTPYQFAGNKPIAAVDLDGLEEHIVIYSQTAQKALLDYKENGLRSMAIQAAYVMTAQRYPSKEEGGNDWHLEKYPKVNWPEDRSAATYNNSAPIKGLLVQGVRENGETYTILSVSGVEAAQEKTSLLDKLLTDRVNGGIMLTASNGIAQNQEVRKSTRNGIGVVNIDGLFDWLSMPGAPGVVASQGLKSFVNGLKIGFYLGPKVMNELEGERTSPVSYKEKWKFGRVLIQETDSHTGGKTLFSLDTINFFESENGIIKFDTVPGKLTPRANVSTRHEWSKKSKDFTKTE